jgi:phage shock protein A
MKRFFRWLKAIFNRGMDKLEDPDIMLDQARRDMSEALIANREKAVQAITQKNRLQGMMDEQVRKSNQLEQQATMALQQGNRDLARQFIREKANVDAVIGQLKTSLDNATQAVEAVKLAIKRQEEEVRKKTAEALALKAQWKQAQIQNSITKALEGLTFENQYEGFGAAKERIDEMQAEAAARNEMMGTSLQGKIMQMEDSAMDMQAEADLQKLEQRLGMGAPATTTQEQTVSVSQGGPAADLPAAPDAPASEVDRQLDELEKRLGGGSASS